MCVERTLFTTTVDTTHLREILDVHSLRVSHEVVSYVLDPLLVAHTRPAVRVGPPAASPRSDRECRAKGGGVC